MCFVNHDSTKSHNPIVLETSPHMIKEATWFQESRRKNAGTDEGLYKNNQGHFSPL